MHIRRLVLILALLLAVALPSAADEEEVTVTATAFTNVRSGPGTNYSIVGFLLEGDTVIADGRDSTANSWLRIDYDDGEGWVATSVVTVTGDPTTLDVVADAGGEETTGNSDVTATPEDTVNVRIGPGSSYAIVGQAEGGTTLDVVGVTSLDYPLVCRGSSIFDTSGSDEQDDVWLQVNFNGYDAWVNYSVVAVSGPLCDVEEAEFDSEELMDALPDEVQDALDDVILVTQENTNLRFSNYPTSEVILVIPYDETLVAEARDSNSERVRVTYDDETGWISLSLVSISRGNVDDLPVEEE